MKTASAVLCTVGEIAEPTLDLGKPGSWHRDRMVMNYGTASEPRLDLRCLCAKLLSTIRCKPKSAEGF